jgi:putative ATP-binding cassette transporter
METQLRFDKQFVRHFWQLLKPYWASSEKYTALKLFFMNALCVIVEVRARVSINQFSNDFYNALQTFDRAALMTSLIHFTVILTVLLIATGYSVYFTGMLCLRWRQWMTENFIQKWLQNHSHYHMRWLDKKMDNPDQRISEDLQKFSDLTVSLFFQFFYALLIVIVFGYILCHFSFYLFFAALIYAVLGSWVMSWIGKKLSALDYQQQQYNADFRFALVNLRETSEQVSLWKSEHSEKNRFNFLFQNIFQNYKNMLVVKRSLTFFNNGYNTASFLFGMTAALPLYLRKKIQLGGLMQISGAFSYVIGSFSLFVNSFNDFAEWRAVIYRLTEFENAMLTAKANSYLEIKHHEDDSIILKDVSVFLPDNQILFEKFNFRFEKAKKYFMTGPSGMGKSTLLKTIAGLWPHAEGKIFFPSNAKILFCPQKSIIPIGSFKDAITYSLNENFSDSHLEKILKLCKLEKFISKLYEINDYSKILSEGEQQLIAFARIFLHNPDFVFLDEANSLLDEKTERELYEALRNEFPEMTIISVSHRVSLYGCMKGSFVIKADVVSGTGV